MSKTITLAHGNGGKLSHDLISELFVPAFSNAPLGELADGARLEFPTVAAGQARIVFTSDSHVVTPLFFAGGDIGKLAVTGTVNDLAVMGAKPLYLSCAMIIEEGFPYEELRRVVQSMAKTAEEAGVRIVTGDTKVVPKGAADRLFINTSGIGLLPEQAPKGAGGIEEGDVVILSGSVGDHGIAIYAGREGINLQTDLKSDCAVIEPLTALAMAAAPAGAVRVMRDPTRGGLATTLNEFVLGSRHGVELEERAIPVREEVRGICELLGFDPLYVANEGKLVLVVAESAARAVVEAMRRHPLGAQAAVVGKVTRRAPGRVYLKTVVGGERIVDMLVGDMLPRIC